MAASVILNDGHLQTINKALQDLDTLENELELARRAGLMNSPIGTKLQAAESQMKASRDMLLAIKNVYFPNSH